MSYEIENYGPQYPALLHSENKNNLPDSLPTGGGTPNFPPNYSAGQESLSFGNDLRFDPADEGYDPKDAYGQGIDMGSQDG